MQDIREKDVMCIFNNLFPANLCVQSESHCLADQLKEGVYVIVLTEKVRAGRDGTSNPLTVLQGEVNGPSSREYFLFDNVKINVVWRWRTGGVITITGGRRQGSPH